VLWCCVGAVRRGAVLCGAGCGVWVWCGVVWCAVGAVLCRGVSYRVVSYRVVLCFVVLCCVVLCCVVLFFLCGFLVLRCGTRWDLLGRLVMRFLFGLRLPVSFPVASTPQSSWMHLLGRRYTSP